ncbi:RNA polymerase factor sigma-54 [Ligilactobacillus sp. WILCCON 0076]|uniref:RNA polymerase factor sigma-54 n=1 Tax=Ligilactobacillus ubinensis TaxID=2876789 RepID=A0A9X2FHU1_9LACO|nr:RNA polymerase factor sigma-54 [Ligilactobacillus ubinensis]MCP0886342.1 RNA polymerase factor sigma-54 [Ligilactobacillus ubinensis]
MSLEQGFSQQQKQIQKLAMTQKMQQSIQILKYNIDELQNFLKQKELENPFISVSTQIYNSTNGFKQNKEDWQNYTAIHKKQSLFEYLLDQVHLTMRKTELRYWVIYLIEHLDSNGYLKINLENIQAQYSVSQIVLYDALTLLQRLDPPGVGARNLQECLLLQIEEDDYAPKLADTILKNDFVNFTDKKWELIAKKYEIEKKDIQQILDYVRTLSPAPGAAYSQDEIGYIIPDLIVIDENDILSIKATKQAKSHIVFRQRYYNSLVNTKDNDVLQYMNLKKKEYEQLQQDVQQRENTVLLVGKEILKFQHDFFVNDSHPLKRLLLRDVAHKLQLHESTISRAVNGKYIQTSFGIFELKHFFSQAGNYQRSDGKQVSASTVKQKIKALINEEDKRKPLSDQKIAIELSNVGLKLSRRTVAKYREQLDILGSSKRKRFE